jgi:hypothetical protein
MLICAAGDIHGAMDRLYEDVTSFEGALGVCFDFVLHVGDFGIWPDSNAVDKATRKHDGAGDFPAWLAANRDAPRRTVFIKGNHEDFVWLDAQSNREILPNLIYLPNGQTIDLISGTSETIRVGGIGGCHGPSNYERPSNKLQGYARRHFTRDEVESLVSHGTRQRIDIVLTHDAPAGVRFVRHRGGEFISEATGLAEALSGVRPRVCFFGHHHTRVDAEVSATRCIGLNKVGRPGNLVAISISPDESEWELIGEWPPHPTQRPTS